MQILQKLLIYISSFFLSILPSTKYIEGVVGQPRSFIPGQTVTQNDKTISKLIFRGLYKYDIYGNLVPDLAESWNVSEDGFVYTIKIKDNQYWSNGDKIVADDLIYTAFTVEDLQGVATDKVDDLTVRYTLPNKFSPFLSMLTIGVVPDNSENMSPIEPVTSGPFELLRTEFSGPVVQQVILISKNQESSIRKLIFRYYENEDNIKTAAELGEIDGFISSKDITVKNFSKTRFPSQGVYYALFFNLRDENLQDLEFRKKLENVLPTEKLTNDLGILTQGPISRSIYTDKTLEFNTFDEDFIPENYAKSFEITVPDIDQHTRLVSHIKDLWESYLGVGVTVKKVDADEMNELIEDRDFEVLFYGQQIGRDPDRYVNWHSTQIDAPGLNLTGFEQVRADRALEEGRNEIDDKDRLVHYHEFQKVINENVPAIFLYHPYINYYVSDHFEGMGEKYTFDLADRFLDFYNWSQVATN